MKFIERKTTCFIFVCLAGGILGGCINCNCNSFNARFERTVELEQPMVAGLRFFADTEFGDIHIIGERTDRCRVTARIHVQAETEEQATEIANKIEVTLAASSRGMEVQIHKPEQKPRYSSGVALTVHVPFNTHLDARTSFGKVEFSDIQGDAKIRTSFGNIHAERVSGPLDLHTSHGAIRCSAITSNSLALNTSFGNVTVGGLRSEGPLTAKVNTSHGSIEFACPEGFGGSVDMGTSFGTIRTEQPIMVKGDFGEEQIKGTIGAGQGSITLRTSFGNIRLN